MRGVRAYTTELDLNHAQVTTCKRHAGAARSAYHWGLQRTQDAYIATGTRPSAMDLHRELNALTPNALKKTELSWMEQVCTCAPQEALRHLDTAFAHVFRRGALQRTGKRTGGTLGYPHPKTKKQGLGSFRLTGAIGIFAEAVQLPRLGRLRLNEHGYLPVTGTSGVKSSCSVPPSRSRRGTAYSHYQEF